MSYKDFDVIVKKVFAPIYPIIAKQIIERTKTTEGICIDLGTGTGALARAIAKITNLKVYALDNTKDMLQLVEKYAAEESLGNKVFPICADVHDMPFKDNFADLIISRGSMFFWKNKTEAFREIYRILKPKGATYIGGGFGTKELKEKIWIKMKDKNPDWENKVKERMRKHSPEKLKEILHEANISTYEIINDESGLWILMRKFG